MRLVRVKRRRSAAHGQDRRRSDRSAGRVCRAARRGALIRRPERLRAQERLAELRHGTGEDLRCARRSRAIRARTVRVQAGWSASAICPLKRKAACRIPPARELRRAGVCVLEAARSVRRQMESGRTGRFSHRAQADPDGALARRRISRLGRFVRRRQVCRAQRHRAALHGRVHGRACGGRDSEAARERAAAHGRLFEEHARSRIEG